VSRLILAEVGPERKNLVLDPPFRLFRGQPVTLTQTSVNTDLLARLVRYCQ
jgi:hypothetical protein